MDTLTEKPLVLKARGWGWTGGQLPPPGKNSTITETMNIMTNIRLDPPWHPNKYLPSDTGMYEPYVQRKASAQIARKMEGYQLNILGISECRWTGDGRMRLVSGRTSSTAGMKNYIWGWSCHNDQLASSKPTHGMDTIKPRMDVERLKNKDINTKYKV